MMATSQDDAEGQAKGGSSISGGGGGSGRIPYWRLVVDQAGITPEVARFPYPGSGTAEDPYLVQWIPDDPRNPMQFSSATKWFITMTVAIATLAVTLVSSAYTGGIVQIMHDFSIGQEVATLGVSLFVLGFAVGPLLWAPLSELFGRQVLFIATYAALTAFNAGCAGARNAWTLMILRFLAGAFGSSPLTNAGGTIADMFPASQRGLALAIFAAAPFLGPVLGPVIGGFLGITAGWRWVMGFLAAFSGALWITGCLCLPETYSPVLLRKRAAALSRASGRCYVSAADHAQGKISLGESIRTALLRPWILLFREPIVLLLSIFMAIIYGTLYMLFAAFPIVYVKGRGWNQGVGGLAFLGIMVGMLFAIAYTIPANKRYVRIEREHDGFAPPEARLPAAMIGAVALPIGLFWFAWTNDASIHWMVSIAAGVPFGFGMVLVFLSIMNYLIDAYTIFAASVLAANSVLRSLFGAAFPLFTSYMYEGLGIHWASSIPAFLALACVPFPFLFYHYGPAIRARCKFAAESAAFMRRLREGAAQSEEKVVDEKASSEKDEVSSGDGEATESEELPFEPVTGTLSRPSIRTMGSRTYEGNPYDIDRVNSRRSFVA
ncbi:major facilitator superfamily protein [Hirsutella rhossiliensis]|uniref:Major facilitator superfamily domain-containing protein n=1 Tax=Hirsutella rhossiliensis TaxID=111463 RepID=A0A9P8SLY5_9HYPO|nr:major facilitator superfamily domain-containing protein [Hirsutella rhossiliensis]KAH0967426.1 major facilitator superfamily domain-containing protein [Hirsutella rhossiliensis]